VSVSITDCVSREEETSAIALAERAVVVVFHDAAGKVQLLTLELAQHVTSLKPSPSLLIDASQVHFRNWCRHRLYSLKFATVTRVLSMFYLKRVTYVQESIGMTTPVPGTCESVSMIRLLMFLEVL
jgi:hypothetical protein